MKEESMQPVIRPLWKVKFPLYEWIIVLASANKPYKNTSHPAIAFVYKTTDWNSGVLEEISR